METKQKTATKDKRRNNEKRKEKSRDAARCRRSRETEIFADLAAALPVSQDQVAQLDKASIMRLAISYLRVRDMVDLVTIPSEMKEASNEDESIFLKSLEGFVMVLSNDGDFVYLSENVSEYLGIGQIDLMGQNIFDYSHPCDHEEIKELLSDKAKDESKNSSYHQRSFFIRLKCTLTSKGRSVNLKSASYKVLHCQGHMLRQQSGNVGEGETGKKLRNCFAAVANPIPHPSNIEAPLPKQTFVTKHGLDMKFVHADDEIMREVLGYKEDELLGKSVYEYHHAMDSDAICSAYKCLFSKGQCETGKYRFLAKNGGFVWVSTQATLIYDKMQKPQSVVCVNHVISGVECRNEIYSAAQLSTSHVRNSVVAATTDATAERPDISEILFVKGGNKGVIVEEQEEQEVVQEEDIEDGTLPLAPEELLTYLDGGESAYGPKRNTEKILTTRTKEMSRGFLTFTEDSGLTMLKEEPEDLTHLAPVAGDVCVPLEEHPFLSDVLDDLLLKDNLSPLMMDEPIDPFISYREAYSPELLSPNFSKNSDSSLPSLLNSPSNSLGDDDHMPNSFLNYDERSENSSLSPVSPYIPMHMDDLPLLLSSSNDLMWGNCGGNSSAPPSPTRKIVHGNVMVNNNNNNVSQQMECSSLAQLLANNDRTSKQVSATSELIGQSSWSARAAVAAKNVIRTAGNKRANSGNVASSPTSKRMKTEPPKDKLSSELFQQLIANNNIVNNKGRPKKTTNNANNWLLDGQKAACVSQPSDSVLMNLLDNNKTSLMQKNIILSKKSQGKNVHRYLVRVNSKSINNNSVSTPITSLLSLTDKDFEMNAPVNNLLLQGEDLIKALDIGGSTI